MAGTADRSAAALGKYTPNMEKMNATQFTATLD